ncbi:MAG: hypothetical protein GQ561_02040, partial [Calditrichae bacterium]|nr:hypothetical protein [Calditrichia bacterium]
MYSRIIVVLLFLLLIVCIAFPQIPQTLSYQGIFSDAGGTLLNGSYDFTFKIYNVETGGTELWSEMQSITVTEGMLNVTLGTVTLLNLAFDESYWLGITVNTSTEMTPRIRLNASAYSLNAQTVVDSAISTEKIANDAVNSAKIQDGSVQITDLAFNPVARPLSPGVSTAEIADSAIIEVKIAAGEVVKSLNGLHDDVSLAAGNNVTIDQLGQTLTINSSGGGGGLSLPYSGTSSTPSGSSFEVTNSGSAGTAISGLASDNASANVGVLGNSQSPLGAGVHGNGIYAGVLGTAANAPDSMAIGVLGQSIDFLGRGVAGIAASSTGKNYGVYGESISENGIGVAGISSKIAGNQMSYGVYGETRADFSTAVYGSVDFASGNGGNSHGVMGRNVLDWGNGVKGIAVSDIGFTKGVWGEAWSQQGIAVYGINHSTSTISGSAVGVKGTSSGTEGIGVYGTCTGSDGFGVKGKKPGTPHEGFLGTVDYGVYGTTVGQGSTAIFGSNDLHSTWGSLGSDVGVAGSSSDSLAVYGINTTSGNFGYLASNDYSVYGETSTPQGISIYGKNSNTGNVGYLGSPNYGVYGFSISQFGVFGTSTDADGVSGFSQNQSGVYGESQNHYGVYGRNMFGGNYGYLGSMQYGVYGEQTMEGTAIFGKNSQKGNIGQLGGWDFGVFGQASSGSEHAGYFVGHGYFSGFLGLGMQNPSYRLELPNDPNSNNGRAIAVEWITYSSGRWKENIAPIPDALDKLMLLQGVEFDWKAQRGGQRDIGLIAEEVAQVIPVIVHMEDDGINARGLDYSRLVPLLIEAIKAQQMEIEELRVLISSMATQ